MALARIMDHVYFHACEEVILAVPYISGCIFHFAVFFTTKSIIITMMPWEVLNWTLYPNYSHWQGNTGWILLMILVTRLINREIISDLEYITGLENSTKPVKFSCFWTVKVCLFYDLTPVHTSDRQRLKDLHIYWSGKYLNCSKFKSKINKEVWGINHPPLS